MVYWIRAMSKVEILITGAKAFTPISVQADVSNVANYARGNGFTVRSVLVNDLSLSTDAATSVFYNKKEYRDHFISLMKDSTADHLILYYSGHGSAQVVDLARAETKECLVLSDDTTQWYYDDEITEDIDAYLPANKTLYLVVDACHAGGMINLWQLDRRLNANIVLFAGSNTEIFSWDDANQPGGAFTNAFIVSAVQGKTLYKIAEDVLQQLFNPGMISPAVRYGRPALCVAQYCQ